MEVPEKDRSGVRLSASAPPVSGFILAIHRCRLVAAARLDRRRRLPFLPGPPVQNQGHLR